MSAKRSESPLPAEENPAFKRRKQEKRSSDHTQEELALDATSHQVSALDFTRNFDLNVPGASIFYQDEFIDATTAQQWYDELANLPTWYRPTLKVYGKKITQSRLIAAYSPSPGLTLKYSGQTVIMNYPYPDILSDIQDRVEKALGVSFNHVMLNKYDDGTVYIGKHSDSIENKVIASLSLGADRKFILTPRKSFSGRSRSWTLQNGSLLVMQGETQHNWKHEIPKQPKIKEGRISLTFRQLVYEKTSQTKN